MIKRHLSRNQKEAQEQSHGQLQKNIPERENSRCTGPGEGAWLEDTEEQHIGYHDHSRVGDSKEVTTRSKR